MHTPGTHKSLDRVSLAAVHPALGPGADHTMLFSDADAVAAAVEVGQDSGHVPTGCAMAACVVGLDSMSRPEAAAAAAAGLPG